MTVSAKTYLYFHVLIVLVLNLTVMWHRKHVPETVSLPQPVTRDQAPNPRLNFDQVCYLLCRHLVGRSLQVVVLSTAAHVINVILLDGVFGATLITHIALLNYIDKFEINSS